MLRRRERGITAVAISPENHWLLTGSLDTTARLWDLRVEDLFYRARRITGQNTSVENPS